MCIRDRALRIKDNDPENVKNTVISMGPPQAESMLRDTLAVGAVSYTHLSLKSKKPVDKVKVSILAVTGTNCEWDTKKVFEKYGAEVEINLFRNLDKKAIEESIENLSKSIKSSQIFAIPGGFSMADEPDGSGDVYKRQTHYYSFFSEKIYQRRNYT